jgi:WD40 repeat protein
MYSMSLTIRTDSNGLFVDGETSDPTLAAGTRVSARLELDVHSATQLPVRDLGEVRAYGTMLGEAVFVGDIRAAFHDLLARVPHGDVLHVSLSVEDFELRSLRWERLCCPLHNRKDSPWEFLHLRQETAFSLDLRSAIDRRYPAISRVGLKALVVVADMGPTRPYKLAEFDAAETVAGIRTALGKDILCHVLASSGVLQLPNTDGLPTLDEICRWLTRERFAILHLVCHGEFKQLEEPNKDRKPVTKSDTILYLRKSGDVDPTRKDDHVARVSGTEFLQRLSQCHALPHLTFLCSCSSASAAAEQGLGGLGQRLVRELAMPAVVAMTEPVPIELATEISTEFYHHLRQTGEVDRALTKASASQAGRPTVLVPTHFSRLAGRRLFDDSLVLTTAEWEHGLKRLPALIQERAPVLETIFENLLKAVQPALGICRIAEHSKNPTDDERRARDTLLLRKAELNELCEDFLENSFEHLAKDRPLAIPTYDGRCPFPGLGVFDKVKIGNKEEDYRPFFFGRDLLIREIRELVVKNRFVAVLGGSGSGKSSLIRAGLLEAMRREKPALQAIVFPPGKAPLVRLQTELAAVPNPDILVVDQFEELFTLCADLTQRKEFLKQLLQLKDRIPVVITMRADFLGECANDHDELHQLLNSKEPKYLELIQPIKGNELRSVVEMQAQAVGLRFEPGLASSIFDDLEGEPGAMPLLQHCLRQLWQHRHGRWLRLAEYANEDRVGGVKGAISRTAEDVYQQLVKDVPDASTLLPFIFERLARIDISATDSEQRRDTRRREDLSELTPAGNDARVVKLIVTKLADAKLIVTTQNPETHKTEVEVAHEALIRNWQRLQSWLDAARETTRLVERIRADAGTYLTTPSPDNLTLRGSTLEEASGLLNAALPRLSRVEAAFVRDCQAEETRRINANARRQRITIGVLLGFSLLVSGLALLALRGSWIANAANEESRKRYVRMSTVSGIAARERGEKVAAAHFFANAAVESTILSQRDHLNMAAFHLVEHVSLQAILSHQGVTGIFPFEDSKRVLSWGRDGNIKLWDMEGNQIGKSMPHAVGKPVWSVFTNEDMTNALSSSHDDTIRLWNLRTQDLIGLPLPHKSVRGAKFIAGDRILSWSKDSLKVWDRETQKELQNRGFQLEGDLREIAFSPGNERVFAWSDDQIVAWDFKANSAIFPGISVTPIEDLAVIGAKFLTKELLAVWDESNNIHIYNYAEPIEPTVLKHDGLVIDCQFLEEGKKLLTWSKDHKARLWDIASGKIDKTFDCGFDEISGAMLHHHKEHFLSWSSSGAIRFWDLAGGPPSIVNHLEIVGAKLIPKDKLLSWSSDGSIALWDSHIPKTTSLHAKMHHAELVKGAEATEQNIFTWSEGDGSVRIWKIEPQRRIELRHSSVIGAESIEPQNVITWGGVDKVSSHKPTA